MIDEAIADPWPSQAAAAARGFRQGHIIECPSLFFAHNVDEAISRWDGSVLNKCVVCSTANVQYGIITSQSCDVAEQGKPRKPWIQVAPIQLVEDDGSGQFEQVKRFQIGHLYPLDPDGLEPGLWAADLRIELPLEKSWLVGRQPRKGFQSEEAARDFSIHLGKLRSRPALGNAVSRLVVSTLHTSIQKSGSFVKRSEFFAPVKELWLGLIGSYEAPSGVTLYVATTGAAPTELVAFFDEWYGSVWPATFEAGCPLQANVYVDLQNVSALDYVELTESLVALDFDNLSQV